ncbi:MAG: DMT family transporter [Methanobacterium sp.]
MTLNRSGSNTTLSKVGLGHLLVVYIIWSSTYLAIRIMVAPGSGFAVWTAGSIRLALAAPILFCLAAVSHYRIRIDKREFWILLISGILMWVTGNGTVMWAEQRVNSGFAALVCAAAPISSAIIEAMLDRKIPSRLLIASLLLSFAGIFVLVAPSLVQGRTTELGAGILVFLSTFSWAGASVLQKRNPIDLEAPVVAAYQHLFGGIGFIVLAVLSGQHWPQATSSAWMGLAYLVIFGSVFAFTSYIKALKLLPINITMTYAYVNPILALILGWLLLHESLGIWTLIGALMVIFGIVGVFRDNEKKNREKLEIKNTASL